jgi:hypothetical protein
MIHQTPDKCPHCPQTETQEHLYQCRTRQAWKTEFLKKLDKHLAKYNTEPTLKKLIIKGIQAEIEDIPNKERDEEMKSQMPGKLTWQDLLQGRVNNYFTWIQQDHIRDNQIPTRLDGNGWTKRLIHFLWTELYDNWKYRNDKQHATDGQIQDQFQHAEATNTIRTYYSYAPRLLSADRNKIFAIDMETLLQSKTYSLRRWIATNNKALQRAIADAEKFHRTRCHDIRSYFTNDWQPP